MIETTLIEQIENTFNEKMYECNLESGDTLMCSINDAFKEFPEDAHNCLGCNLEEQAEMILVFLKSASHNDYNKIQFFTMYNMLLYLMTEKILEIKKIIGLPQSYKEREFKVYREIKLWANFLKHPKAFILTHHPRYVFEGFLTPQDHKNIKKLIDFNYIKKHYSREDNNKYKILVRELKSNPDVVVELPDLNRLTLEFCEACRIFIDVIKDNKAYREILNDLTTLENFFEKEE